MTGRCYHPRMLPDLPELGVEDRNGDGIMDYIRSRIYVADDANAEEIAAAANLAARMAFETTSMNLPVGFPVSEYKSGETSIFVGCGPPNINGAATIQFSNIEDAEEAALGCALNGYALVDLPTRQRQHPTDFRLHSLLTSTRQIILGSDVCCTAVIDLAARIGLESTELRLPLVKVARHTDQLPPSPNTILIGLTNPYVQQRILSGKFLPPTEASAGCITLTGDCAIIAGADFAGEKAALQHAALCHPYLREYGKGRASLASIEDEVRRHCPFRSPVPELVFEDSIELPWEVDRARKLVKESLLPVIRHGDSVELELRLSEPFEIRQSLATEIRELLRGSAAIEASSIRVLSAHKQGFCWIDEELKPLLKTAVRVRICFRELDCARESVDSPDRWLHELYPIDEVLARDLGMQLDFITFERVAASATHVYEVIAEDAGGNVVLHKHFDPRSEGRPLFDLFPAYAHARIATGWMRAAVNGATIIDERIRTDYELFWDVYQARVLPRIRDYVVRLHGGRPNPESAPHFDELTVEVQLSEPDFRVGIDEERISTLEALHEDIYFETLLFFDVLGIETFGKPLKYPGRIVPRILQSRAGAGRARVRLTGYTVPFPTDRPFADKDPSVISITLQAGRRGVTSVEILAGTRFSWLLSETQKDQTITARRPDGPPDVPIVQWNEPIGPEECERVLEELASFPEVRPFLAGKSWLGRRIWAMDVVAPIEGEYFSLAKASATKPCLFITGRQHANEVSSTSHLLRLAELLATDPACRKLLDRVNFVIQPITNPDGAALVDELHKLTPEFMLHAGYLGALGVDVTEEQWSDVPRYPEARVRADLWRMWQPDVVLNPHGYPSHEWVQLFAGYTAWVRSRRLLARDWWIPRGWFMPRFDYIDDERFPHHRHAALMLREKISEAIRRSFGRTNERMYKRYAKYLRCEVVLHDGVWIQSPNTGCKVDTDSFGFMTRHPEITFFEGLSEAPDEVASGEWLRVLAAAGLEFSLVHAQFLADLPESVIRTRRAEGGTITLCIERNRLPLHPQAPLSI